MTRRATLAFQRRKGLKCDGRLDRATRRALGARGRPLLGQRELGVGSVGWDVAVLEFRLRRYGLGPKAVDGRFTRSTRVALRRYQNRRGLAPDGIAGPKTYRSLAGRRTSSAPVSWHVVRPGESFFSIAGRYHTSPWRLARRNRLSLMTVIVPNQRLALPRGARLTAPAAAGPPREPRLGARRDRLLVAGLRRRPDACARARVDGVRLPAGRRLERRRARRHAAPARDVGVRRRRAARRANAADVPGQRPRGRALPALAARRVRRRPCASRSRAGTRVRAPCASGVCTARRRSSSASCSRSTARSDPKVELPPTRAPTLNSWFGIGGNGPNSPRRCRPSTGSRPARRRSTGRGCRPVSAPAAAPGRRAAERAKK